VKTRPGSQYRADRPAGGPRAPPRRPQRTAACPSSPISGASLTKDSSVNPVRALPPGRRLAAGDAHSQPPLVDFSRQWDDTLPVAPFQRAGARIDCVRTFGGRVGR
jgi:hypothetical protein